jgi:hypothetical protein
MSITLLHSRDVLSFDSIQELLVTHFQSTNLSWSGETLPNSFKWCLFSDLTHLWFYASIPFPLNNESEENQYEDVAWVEGLWNNDVVELFLLNPLTEGNYIEFNFSPVNAWWCCEFEGYRSPRSISTPPKLDHLKFHLDKEKSCWEVRVALDLQSLPFPIDASTFAHISAIIQQPQRLYLTSNTNRSCCYDPDFHRIESFLPLMTRSIPCRIPPLGVTQL